MRVCVCVCVCILPRPLSRPLSLSLDLSRPLDLFSPTLILSHPLTDLVELSKMCCIERLVSKHTINGKVLDRLERLLHAYTYAQAGTKRGEGGAPSQRSK